MQLVLPTLTKLLKPAQIKDSDLFCKRVRLLDIIGKYQFIQAFVHSLPLCLCEKDTMQLLKWKKLP